MASESELRRKLQAQRLLKAHVLHEQRSRNQAELVALHTRHRQELQLKKQQRLNAEVRAVCSDKQST